MKKKKILFLIDCLMFFSLVLAVSIGLLMDQVLVCGRERIGLYGRGTKPFLFGLSRCEWGDIHLVAVICFLVLLGIHIALHIKVLINLFHDFFSSTVSRRRFLLIYFGIITIILIFPFLL